MEVGQSYAPLSVKQLWKIWLKWSRNKAQQRASRVLAQGIIVIDIRENFTFKSNFVRRRLRNIGMGTIAPGYCYMQVEE